MLSFKPKNNKTLIFSELPAQLLDYVVQDDGTILVTLRLNFYLDPFKVLRGEITSANIDVATSLYSRPGVFDNVENVNTDIKDNVVNRIPNSRLSQDEYQDNNVLASSKIDLTSLLSQDLSDEIINYFNDQSTLENVYQLMPKINLATEKSFKKLKANDKVIEPIPYETENFVVELLSNLKSTKLIQDSIKVNQLIEEIKNTGVSLSELGSFPYPVNGIISDYKNDSTIKISDVVLSKNEDQSATTDLSLSKIGETTSAIEELYQYYVKIKNRSSFKDLMVDKSRTWNILPVNAIVEFKFQESVNRPVKIIMNLLNEYDGVREKYVQSVEFNKLINDYNLVRVPPYISAVGDNSYASLFIRQRDKNSKGVVLSYKNANSTSQYIELATIELTYGEEITYIDDTYYSDGLETPRVYRVHALDSNSKITPVFNDTNLISKTSIIGELEIPSLTDLSQTTCYLDEVGDAGENGKRIIVGNANVSYGNNSIYTVYRFLISENGTKIGERTQINVSSDIINEILDSTSSSTFSFRDEVDPGVWRYEIEASNDSFNGVIHTCEITISENVSYNDSGILINGEMSQAVIQNTTSYEINNKEIIARTQINVTNGANVFVDQDIAEVEFINGQNSFSLKGKNTFTVQDENTVIVETVIDKNELKNEIQNNTGISQSDSSVDSYIKSSKNNHILSVGVE